MRGPPPESRPRGLADAPSARAGLLWASGPGPGRGVRSRRERSGSFPAPGPAARPPCASPHHVSLPGQLRGSSVATRRAHSMIARRHHRTNGPKAGIGLIMLLRAGDRAGWAGSRFAMAGARQRRSAAGSMSAAGSLSDTPPFPSAAESAPRSIRVPPSRPWALQVATAARPGPGFLAALQLLLVPSGFLRLLVVGGAGNEAASNDGGSGSGILAADLAGGEGAGEAATTGRHRRL